MHIAYKKLSDKAIQPTQAHPFDAGYDLYATEDYVLESGERHPFPTDIALTVPEGWYARIAPRSGLAIRNGIDVLGGVIDHSYTGNYTVILINLGSEPFTVHAGDRIAQLIIEKCAQVERIQVNELEETDRGGGGFGSSGV